jgi:VanZ family protein
MNAIAFLSSWAPVLVWAGLIYFLSSIPHLNSGLGKWDTFLRKGAHIIEYTVLTALVLRALRQTWRHWPWRQATFVATAVVVLYACSDEFHQSFVPGRGPSPVDVLIDSVGVIVGIYFMRRIGVYE